MRTGRLCLEYNVESNVMTRFAVLGIWVVWGDGKQQIRLVTVLSLGSNPAPYFQGGMATYIFQRFM